MAKLAEAIDSFISNGRNVLRGQRLEADDPLVRAHPGLFFAAGDLADDDPVLLERRRAAGERYHRSWATPSARNVRRPRPRA